MAIVYLTLQERTIGLLCHFAQTRIGHGSNHRFRIVNNQISHGVLHLLRNWLVLHHDVKHSGLHLLVLANHIDGVLVIGHLLRNHVGSSCGSLDATKHLLDLRFRTIYVDITHHDDTLILRIVPLAIVSTQSLGITAIHNLHQTDGETLTVL